MKVGVRGGPAKTKTRTVTGTRPHQKKGQRGEPNAKVPIEWKSAVDSLRQLQGTKRAKVRDYNDAINACAKARQLGPALTILGDMVEDGLDPNVYSYGSLLNACARTRDWETALELLGDGVEVLASFPGWFPLGTQDNRLRPTRGPAHLSRGQLQTPHLPKPRC